MQKEVKKSWALFIGIGVMMIAHGLQMQVMGIRSVLEDLVFLQLVFSCLDTLSVTLWVQELRLILFQKLVI